ncbi:MAG: carboxypeptidase-like regulatory domain-containing protein, partial [Dehalococcoidia bacterium]|nr:carboxypeptidase-like regulatory domain-containing protein [Dehalococcoidia bacterium]
MPPTPTVPPPTPTVPPFPFVVENSFGSPDCSKTEISGYLIDKSRQGLSGYSVTVGNVSGGVPTTSTATGSDGRYSINLAPNPIAGRWYVVVVDSAGKELSPRTQIETTVANCGAG